MDGRNRSMTALASFPGSGNTWVRGLLQRATGFCTGAIYCDGRLRSQGFPGEFLISSSVLVVKTHETTVIHNPRGFSNNNFGNVILIVRDPFHALIANWHRHNSLGHHTSVVDRAHFG